MNWLGMQPPKGSNSSVAKGGGGCPQGVATKHVKRGKLWKIRKRRRDEEKDLKMKVYRKFLEITYSLLSGGRPKLLSWATMYLATPLWHRPLSLKN